MDFLKKNYEKLLLGLVLAGLVVAVVFLLFLVGTEKQRLEDLRNGIINRPVKPLEPPMVLDVQVSLQRATLPVKLDLAHTNRVFNPLRWQKAADGKPYVSEMGGMKLIQVTNARPLYFIVSLDSISMSETGARYGIGVNQQAAARPRGKQSVFVSAGEKKDPILLRQVKGPPENPTELLVELTETGEVISINREKPFRRVDSYMVDIRTPDGRMFTNRRIDSPINFGGVEYKVLGITHDEVVLSAPNQKHWTIKYSAAQ